MYTRSGFRGTEIKTTAEYFRRGLMLGLHSVADVMHWLDRMWIGLVLEEPFENGLDEKEIQRYHNAITLRLEKVGWRRC